jgi:hypothetical protein
MKSNNHGMPMACSWDANGLMIIAGYQLFKKIPRNTTRTSGGLLGPGDLLRCK